MPVILHHLNADSSWLVSFSEPNYTLLLDPWFTGPQVDFHPLFSSQSHVIPSQFTSIQELTSHLTAQNRRIDAVIVSFEFSDHLHKETIEGDGGLGARTPFFALPRAGKVLRSWGRECVQDIPEADSTVKVNTDPDAELAIELSYVTATTTYTGRRLHGALAISFPMPEQKKGVVLCSPHGIPSQDLEQWYQRSKNKREEIVAVISGWDAISNPWWLGGAISLGAPSIIPFLRSLPKPSLVRYWIRTHDEHKDKRGLVGKVLRRDVWTKDMVSKEFGPELEVVELGSGEQLGIDW
uniref:Metallo-beta-lactamase domain-containing protein n=1 Tax=Moniliophthora roreri TaxID=221103 RepID=A0A0W0FRJ5_MONRR